MHHVRGRSRLSSLRAGSGSSADATAVLFHSKKDDAFALAPLGVCGK